MIRGIESNLPSFKTLQFKQGLNILLADKSPGATERQTLNRAGKSSLIEIVHFLLGADCAKDSIFRSPALRDFSFRLRMDLGTFPTIVSRSGAKPSRIVNEPDSDSADRLDVPAKFQVFSNNDWRQLLGALMFGLRSDELRYGPTFRSLISYFVRRQSAEAFSAPMQNSTKQQLWDQQVAVTFLLGLDWTIPQTLEQVREREKAIRTLRAIARQGILGAMIPAAADLRTQMTLAKEHVGRLQGQLAQFRVLPEYHDLEREASRLTVELGGLHPENSAEMR